VKLELFLDRQKKARIRLRARNGRILMSSEAYSSKSKAMKTAIAIRMLHFPDIVNLTRKK